MTSRCGPIDRARRRATDDQARVIADLVSARHAAGISRAEVGRRCALSRSAVERLERGRRRSTLDELARIGAVVGLDVRLRAFPGGDAIRDAGQQRLLERLRREIHPDLRWRTEVPLAVSGDLRAWDAVIGGRGWAVAVEAETVLIDLQAVERRLELKRRDDAGRIDHLVLLVADTPRNRAALASAPAAFAALPARTRAVLATIRAGRLPPSDGIVIR
jgi:transcriptional regulator with XRE-family HTH domain